MDIKNLSMLVNTQDNRITADPIFVVERKRRDWGYDSEYSDDYKWVSDDDEPIEADDEKNQELDEIDDMCGDTGGWRKVYYVDRWEFVTACFTEQGCKDYIACNGHNLGETRIYAHSGYRNSEWIGMRKYLKDLGYTNEVPHA